MLPLGDDDRDRRLSPYVTLGLIALNVLVFVVFQGLGANDDFTYSLSTVPAEIATGRDMVTSSHTVKDPVTGQVYQVPGLRPTPFSVYLTLLTSMFMHGGLAHILGNMLFLYIFGDNLEDAMGRGRFLTFYLVCGVIASLSHVATTYLVNADPAVPSLGASGAISGVLGGYWLLFPQRRVRVLMGRAVTEVPALVAIGLWFAFQLINGLGMLGGGSDGVAYGAHIGGFVAGLILVKLFAAGGAASTSTMAYGRRY